MTIEDMKQGVSKIRNLVIARVFRELHLIEQWGSGVCNILREAVEQGLPEPLVQEIGMRLRFTVYLAESLVFDKQRAGSRSGAQSISILNVLSESPLSIAAVAEALGLGSKTGAFKRMIKELLDQRLIAYTIPEKPSSRAKPLTCRTRSLPVLLTLITTTYSNRHNPLLVPVSKLSRPR